MNTMHQEGNALIYENDGELLRIEPWGKNSLRVRSVMQGQICDTDYALIELNEADKAIVTSITKEGVITISGTSQLDEINAVVGITNVSFPTTIRTKSCCLKKQATAVLSIKTADASTELLAVLTTCMFPSHLLKMKSCLEWVSISRMILT